MVAMVVFEFGSGVGWRLSVVVMEIWDRGR